MSGSQLFMSVGHRDAIAGIMEGVLGSSDSVVLSGTAGSGKTTVLNVVAAELALASARVVQVTASAARPIGLRDFVAQVAGLAAEDGLGDEDKVRAFEALTDPDSAGNRIVLIVDGAEALQPEALRYIMFACKAQSGLQIIFAGRPEFEEHLEALEFSFLRGRLARVLTLSPLSDEEAAGLVEQRLQAAHVSGHRSIADSAVLGALLRHSQGNPGRINAVLDQALIVQKGKRQDAGSSAAKPPRVAVADSPPARARFALLSASMWSGVRRRLLPPAWALIWVALLVEVGVYTATLPSPALVQEAQRPAVAAMPPAEPVPLSSFTAQPKIPEKDAVANAAAAPAVGRSPEAPKPQVIGQVALPSPNSAPETTHIAIVPEIVPELSATALAINPVQPAPLPAALIAGIAAPTPAVAPIPDLEPAVAPPAAVAPVAPVVSSPGPTMVPSQRAPEFARAMPQRRPARLAGAFKARSGEGFNAFGTGSVNRMTRASAAASVNPYCQSIVLRMQIGEDLTDDERDFLRSGCRPD